MRSFVFAECFAIGMLYSEKNELNDKNPRYRTLQIPGRWGLSWRLGFYPLERAWEKFSQARGKKLGDLVRVGCYCQLPSRFVGNRFLRKSRRFDGIPMLSGNFRTVSDESRQQKKKPTNARKSIRAIINFSRSSRYRLNFDCNEIIFSTSRIQSIHSFVPSKQS